MQFIATYATVTY